MAVNNPPNVPFLNYKQDLETCTQFLEKFSVPSLQGGDQTESKYRAILDSVAQRQTKRIEIELDDIEASDNDGPAFAFKVQRNVKRYLTLFSSAVDRLLPLPDNEVGVDDDVLDVIIAHRMKQFEVNHRDELTKHFPAELLRRFEIVIKPSSKAKTLSVREIKASDIGSLVTLQGMVTRVSDVKPKIVVATYTCDLCSYETYQEVVSKTFMPLLECTSPQCTKNGIAGRLYLQTRGSKFVKFQELKLQELAEQVPVGHIPRSMSVFVTGENTRMANPGDIIKVSGVFLPTPHSGFQAGRTGLVTDTFLEAMSIEPLKRQYNDYAMTADVQEKIEDLKNDPDVYTKLSQSIAPEIYGHEDVKKALLLLLVGGVTRVMDDGMKIRGDINICLMGDPGVAKSQLLKYIANIAPRGVYTTGKGSSGVGLTAAVLKDPTTNEMILEGGALVLADCGVCCIDEFDKMDESDRTAIHEVMEQQTVSISKAGINTTLNARTSILAAANPAYGRYNPKKSPLENINLPAALLSRFDLLFLLLDTPNHDGDLRMAQHITYVHTHGRHPPLAFEAVDPHTLRGFISQARALEPYIPSEDDFTGQAGLSGNALQEYIVSTYAKLRNTSKDQEDMGYISPRTLLGILRLSQSLARLRFSRFISQADVDEALRLMNASKSSLDNQENEVEAQDPESTIYMMIRDLAIKKDDPDVQYDEILPRVLAHGLTQANLDSCLTTYEQLSIWVVNYDRTSVRFLGY